MTVNILGIHYGHDANVALVRDGEVVAAMAEERLSRVKFDNCWPERSLQWILESNGLTLREIDRVAVVGHSRTDEVAGGSVLKAFSKFELPPPPLARILNKPINLLNNLFPTFPLKRFLAQRLLYAKLEQMGFARHRVKLIDHHFAHAAGAFYLSGFDRGLVVTCDGKGDGASHKTYVAKMGERGATFELKSLSRAYESIGLFYSTVTEFLGFRRLRHEGKVTGLAAFGRMPDLQGVGDPVKLAPDGKSLRNQLISSLDRALYPFLLFKFFLLNRSLFWRAMSRHSAVADRYAGELYMQFLLRNLSAESKEDVAYYAQKILESVVTELVVNQLEETAEKNICLSGGTFGNVRLNQKIKEIPGAERVFVIPGMGDGGLAVGAALSVYEETTGSRAPVGFSTAYLGNANTDQQIETALHEAGLVFERASDIESRIAAAIHSGKIVGRFNGRMEWGPRALGNRTIVARPTDASINQQLNSRLNRTEFMPFAPAILKERCAEYFLGYSSEDFTADFMTITYDVDPGHADRIRAVVHVDGTARPQCVSPDSNPSFYKVIAEYERLSGIPVVINTSFNMHEEPIVATVHDAIRALNQNAVDFLAIGNYWVG